MSKEIAFTAKSEAIANVKSRMKALGLPVPVIEKEISFALQLINRSPDLLQCHPPSVLESILNAANFGLTLNPAAKEACLVPRWNGKLRRKECSLEPLYGGLITLATREGIVTSIVAQAVYKGDHFQARPYDNQQPIDHTFSSFDTDRSNPDNIIGFYAIATFADGTRQAEIMSRSEVDAIRDNSDAYIAFKAGKISSTPWSTSYGEMGRKTPIKRLYKYLNKKGDSKLSEVIELDNQGYQSAAWQSAKIDDLLRSANLTEAEMNGIYREYESYTYQQAKDCIAYLEENQLPKSPRYDGRMNQAQARSAVKEAVDNPNT